MTHHTVRYLLFSVSCFVIVVATGCSAGRYYPKFTTVNEVVELRGGVSLADAITSLRCKPHDVLIKQGGGYSIYNWQYKANRDYYRSLELDLSLIHI